MEERRETLKGLPTSIPIIGLFGERDECTRETDIPLLMNNLKESSNGIIKCELIKGGNHGLDGIEESFINDHLMKWIDRHLED